MPNSFNLDTNITFGTNVFGKETVYNVQTVSFPGLSLTVNQLHSRQDVLFANQASRQLEYSPLIMTLICDEDMKVWTELVQSIINSKDSDGFSGDGWIEISNAVGETVLTVRYHNIIPSTVGPLEYSITGLNDEMIFELEVYYDYYTINEEISLKDSENKSPVLK